MRVGAKACLDLGEVEPAEDMVVRFTGVATIRKIHTRETPAGVVREAILETLELTVSE